MRQLTKNIEKSLSELFVEKYLYNFIRDFLYPPKIIFFNSPFNWGDVIIELPIVGSNYMILFDETKLKQNKTQPNLFIKTKSEENYGYNFEILGDFTLLKYKTFKFKNFMDIYGWFFVNIEIIEYDMEKKIITNDDSFKCRYIVVNDKKKLNDYN